MRQLGGRFTACADTMFPARWAFHSLCRHHFLSIAGFTPKRNHPTCCPGAWLGRRSGIQGGRRPGDSRVAVQAKRGGVHKHLSVKTSSAHPWLFTRCRVSIKPISLSSALHIGEKKDRLSSPFFVRQTKPRLSHMQTTIEREIRPRGVAAFIRRDPRNDGGDFFWFAQAFGRHTGDDFL